jgi:PAS domain-containing protein
MAGSHVDITAWKQMEQTLREMEQRYRTVVESVPCGILVVDADGNIHDSNPPAAHMLGVSSEQLAHGSLVELCQCAVHEDGSAFGEGEIRDLIRADAEQQCHPTPLTEIRVVLS